MSALATPHSASLWVWMPMRTPPSCEKTMAVAEATCEGSDEPLVSHRTTVSAPAPAPARHAEGGDLGMREALGGEQREELGVLGVGRREAGLDEVHAEGVERVGDAQLLGRGQRQPLALQAVAQGGVVELDVHLHARG